MSFVLGAAPAEMTIRLSRDTDFYSTIRNSVEAWETGSEIKLVFADDTVWTAEITDADAFWSVSKIDVNTILSSSVLVKGRVRLIYTFDAKDVLWATGKVSINE